MTARSVPIPDAPAFTRARDFVVRNARLIDRRLFAHLFEDAPRQPVLDALRAYRNPDGGFGNALEPDKRCPESQPVDAEVALGILDLVGGSDDPMVHDACDWLDRNADASGGLPFALPWPIKWPAISPGVELDWRGRVTIDALLAIGAYEGAGFAPSR